MKGPSTRRLSIAANTRKLEVDNRFSLKKYYRAADNLLKQAHIYREEKNLIELYVLLLRFSSLVGETLPEHRDYKVFPADERAAYTQKFTHVLLELENLKPEVQREVDRFNKQNADAVAVNTRKQENSIEWPPIYRVPEHANHGSQRNEVVPHKFQNSSLNITEQLNKFSLKFPPPNKETLSRHSFLGPDGLRACWKPPVAVARVEYPSYNDLSMDAASLDQNWSKMLSCEVPSTITTLEAEVACQKRLEAGPFGVASQPNLIKQPSPPPVLAPVQDLPVMSELLQLVKPEDSLPPSIHMADSCPAPISDLAKNLEASDACPKQLHISIKMMDEFMRLAGKNTRNNIETCAVLAGSFKNATFNVTALIIPKQQATANTCHTENEEEIFEWQDKEGLFQLGWIHTHPTQSCFMSSVDLHTHYSYQVMLPEAIAIVMAPTDTRRKYGIFRLSDPGGVKTIQKCQLRGFHTHDPPLDGSQIYEHSAHVSLSTDLKFKIVDLR